jgi:CubicO group peptidase (beta-lactamase class C family)
MSSTLMATTLRSEWGLPQRADVRFEIGAQIAMSAIPPIADKLGGGRFVRLVPRTDLLAKFIDPTFVVSIKTSPMVIRSPPLARRSILAGAGAAVMTGITGLAHTAELDWQSVASSEAGFSDLEARFDRLVADKRVWNLHGVAVARGGRLVFERYFQGEENSWGKQLGAIQFGPATLHNLYSVTKGVVALVYGAALAEGKVPPPTAPLYEQFPEYKELAEADPQRKERTIAHALTMTLGLQWDEILVPYTDPRNDEIGMEMTKDRYRFILERPVLGPPGKRWLYCGGATTLLGRIITKGTGRALPDYARTALFEPLGLGPTQWINNRDTWVAANYGPGDGEPVAASGLRMTPRDLVRIGQLILNNGAVGRRQVLPAEWLTECLTPRVSVDEQRRYGYQWYIGDFEYGSREKPRLDRWVGCFGNGGQRLFVMPELDLVVAITAGNYGTPDQWRPPIRVMREAVLASIK